LPLLQTASGRNLRSLAERGVIGEGEWVLAILAVHGDPPRSPQSGRPVVIDMAKATARQLVIEDPSFASGAGFGGGLMLVLTPAPANRSGSAQRRGARRQTRSDRVVLGIAAPRHVAVVRSELIEEVTGELREASDTRARLRVMLSPHGRRLRAVCRSRVWPSPPPIARGRRPQHRLKGRRVTVIRL